MPEALLERVKKTNKEKSWFNANSKIFVQIIKVAEILGDKARKANKNSIYYLVKKKIKL